MRAPQRRAIRRRLTPFILGAAALGALALPGAAIAQGGADPGSGVTGHVYLDDNPAGANAIAGFARQERAQLHPASVQPALERQLADPDDIRRRLGR